MLFFQKWKQISRNPFHLKLHIILLWMGREGRPNKYLHLKRRVIREGTYLKGGGGLIERIWYLCKVNQFKMRVDDVFVEWPLNPHVSKIVHHLDPDVKWVKLSLGPSYRYYGCGLPFPTAVKGLNVLDFGSGTGRDCFILSKLVGKDGFVTGVDMTEEQVHAFKLCSQKFPWVIK